MQKRQRFWLALLMAFIFVGGAMAGSRDEDRPVAKSPSDRVGIEIVEGVHGEVTAADGSAVVGALVEAKSLDRPGKPIPELAILTDADGRYRWPLLPGGYAISVSMQSYRSATQQATVQPGQVTILDFRLEPVR